MKGHQLALAVQLRESATFDSYHAGPNDEVISAVRGQGSLLLIGASGSGKTHLLHALARTGAAYLPLRDFVAHGPETLDGFSSHSCLLLDDADAVTPDIEWSLALLRLIDQRLASGGSRTLISLRTAPESLECPLADLKTRLNQLTRYSLKPLNQAERADILRRSAQQRGLHLPDEVIHWMLTRLQRDTGSLLSALERLDRAALTAKRRLTLPFVQQALGAPAREDAHTG